MAEQRFQVPVGFAHFEEFEQHMIRPTSADHGIEDAMVARVRARHEPHQGPDGAQFVRPMHVCPLRKAH